MLNLLNFKHKHYQSLLDMLGDQNCPWIKTLSYKTLPKTGYIVMAGSMPIAAGFLRKVEGGYGQLDTFVTNPYAGAKLRHEAIEMVTEALLEDAKSLKLVGVILFSREKTIIDRASAKGFVLLPDSLLAKTQV